MASTIEAIVKKMPRVAIVGASGQLGRSLVTDQSFGEQNSENLLALGRDFDIRDTDQLVNALRDFGPDWVVNVAAFTSVDRAEAEPDHAFAVNAIGAANVARVSRDIGARTLFVSTEAVFEGTKGSGYVEEDPRRPVSVYGASKAAGEDLSRILGEATVIVRTSWLYSAEAGTNFPTRLLEKLRGSEEPVPVVTDLFGNPTSTTLLSGVISRMIHSDVEPGVFHVATRDSCSKYKWAGEIANTFGFGAQRIVPAESKDFAGALRPLYVDLNSSKVMTCLGVSLPSWREDFLRTFERHISG